MAKAEQRPQGQMHHGRKGQLDVPPEKIRVDPLDAVSREQPWLLEG